MNVRRTVEDDGRIDSRETAADVDAPSIESYHRGIEKGFTLTMERIPGEDGKGHPPTPDEADAGQVGGSALRPREEEINADALLIYSRTRYMAARRGLVTPHEFATDLVRHVRSQLPARHAAAAATAASIRRKA